MRYALTESLLIICMVAAPGIGPDLYSEFIKNDKTPLMKFLESWHTASKSIAPEDALDANPRFERELYRLYGAFVEPADSYKDIIYVLVPDEVGVTIC